MYNTKVTNLDSQLKPLAGATMHAITVSSSALSGANYTLDAKTSMVLVEVQTAGVTFTFNGDTPTASSGHVYATGTREFWTAEKWKVAKFIRSTGSDGKVTVSQFNK